MRQLTEACKSARSEEPSFPESTVRLLSEVGSPFVIPNALLDMLGAGAHARPIQPEVQRKEAQIREEAPVEAKPAGAGWMGKMRQAISALGAADEQISQTASESGTPSRPAAEVAHSSPPALPVRPQMPVAESKPSWSPQVSEDKADVPAAKVIQFRSANEGWPRDAQLSATDAFMPGAVAPSLPNFVPAAEPKREPADVPVSSPSVVRGTPDVASAPATVPAKLALRAGTNWPEETLRPIEKRLATIVGPLARVLVNRAAAQANNLDELVSLLVTKLPTEADRTAFLSAKSEFYATAVAQVAADPSNLTLNRTTIGMPESAIDQHSIEHAIQILARYVGPIASVLAKRAAGRARSTEELHLLLAERVEDSKRAQFLKECSIARGN
jgi:hypothetical protein